MEAPWIQKLLHEDEDGSKKAKGELGALLSEGGPRTQPHGSLFDPSAGALASNSGTRFELGDTVDSESAQPDPRAHRDLTPADVKSAAVGGGLFQPGSPAAAALSGANAGFIRRQTEAHPPAQTPDYITNPAAYMEGAPDHDPNDLHFSDARASQQQAPQQPVYQNVAASEQPLTSPARQRDMARAFDQQGNAIEGQKEEQFANGVAQGGVHDATAEGQRAVGHAQTQAAIGDIQRSEANKNEYLANAKKIHDQIAANAAEKEDPNHLWNNLGLGDKVRYKLAGAIGGFLKGFNGLQHNEALDHLQAEIAKDISAQRENHNRQKDKLSQSMTAYDKAYQVTGNANDAYRLATGAALEGVKNEAAAMATQANTPLAMSNAKLLVGHLDERMGQLGREKVAAGIQENKYIPAHQVQVGGPTGRVSDIKPEEVIRLPNGKYVSLPKEDREKVVGAQHVAADVEEAGRRVKQLASVPILQRGVTWQREMLEAGKVFTRPEIAEGGKGGKGMFEIFTKPIDPTAFIFTPGVAANVDDIVKTKQQEARRALQTSAQHYVTPTTRRDPKKPDVEERAYIIDAPYKDDTPEHSAGGAPGFKPLK